MDSVCCSITCPAFGHSILHLCHESGCLLSQCWGAKTRIGTNNARKSSTIDLCNKLEAEDSRAEIKDREQQVSPASCNGMNCLSRTRHSIFCGLLPA